MTKISIQPVPLGPAIVGLTAEQLEEIEAIFSEHAAGLTVEVFGSRAHGVPGPGADLDLLLSTADGSPVDLSTLADLREAFCESSLPFFVDLTDRARCTLNRTTAK